MREAKFQTENSGLFLIFGGAAVKRFVRSFFIISATCLCIWAANAAVAVDAGTGSDNSAVHKADKTFQSAAKKSDAKALGAILDEQFSWTNESGQTQARAQFLGDSTTAAHNGDIEYTDMEAREYGQLAIVTGLATHQGHPDIFFVRVWEKRPTGWRLFVQQDTGVLPKGGASQQPPPTGNVGKDSSDCENPCRSVPFAPKTADQQEVVKAYQAVETAVTKHDGATWAYHVADEFKGIGRRYMGKPDIKEERVAQINQPGSGPVILPRMLSLQVFTFGNAAIMLAEHQPNGEPPFHVIRAWVNRDGRWQLFHRQETTIQHPTDGTTR